MKKLLILSLFTVALLDLTGCASSGSQTASTASSPNAAPAGSGVWFLEPQNGAAVGQTFKVKFGVKGMDVEAAGEQKKDKGHHHLIINAGSKAAGEIIPFDDQHMHFGKGQTEADVKLPPGNYKLTMQFADGFHLSYGQPMSASINVTVK